MVCPVLFELLQKWTTQRFTIVKKSMDSPQNHVQKFVFHNVVTEEFPLPIFGSTCDVTGNVAQFNMADDSNFEERLRGESGP